MHFPLIFHMGGIEISAHFLFNFLAIFCAVRYYLYLRKRTTSPIPKEHHLTLVLSGFLGALLGARLLDMAYVAPTSLLESVGYLEYLFVGGKTIAGALIGGIVGIELAKRITGTTRSTGDLFTYPLILGIMIGRIGCFLTGVSDDTVGLPSTLPWAIDQGDGVPRHPSALYEILFLGVLWVALVWLRKKADLAEGVVFRLFIVSYMVFRFLGDFLKPGTPLLLTLTAIQLACVPVFLWYCFDIARLQHYGRAVQHPTPAANSTATGAK